LISLPFKAVEINHNQIFGEDKSNIISFEGAFIKYFELS